MDNKKLANELIKIAKVITDTPEDIAYDVVSRIFYDHKTIEEAFKSIGYSDIYKKIKRSDLPSDFNSFGFDKKVESLTKAIGKHA